MSEVLHGTSVAPTDGPLHRRTFLAAAGVRAPAVAEAAPVALAATGRTLVRVATAALNGRVFTAARGSVPAQALSVGSDGNVLAVGTNAAHDGNAGAVRTGRRAGGRSGRPRLGPWPGIRWFLLPRVTDPRIA